LVSRVRRVDGARGPIFGERIESMMTKAVSRVEFHRTMTSTRGERGEPL
jgi:hypothetical protein